MMPNQNILVQERNGILLNKAQKSSILNLPKNSHQQNHRMELGTPIGQQKRRMSVQHVLKVTFLHWFQRCFSPRVVKFRYWISLLICYDAAMVVTHISWHVLILF
ncbi:hypothetical protein V6N12_027423 [Hibiscus sabdariffa]|uniref:Uncharacterized protein n=1 Tax=Hibiscus sabdariffa TaxID=183260 RepID=A0ABR2DVT2_9ROSI